VSSEEGIQPQEEEMGAPAVPLVHPGAAERLREEYSRPAPGVQQGWSEAQLFNQFMKGEMTLPEMIFLMDFLDRKERRERDAEKKGGSEVTKEDIAEAVAKAVRELIGKKDEEMPQWARELQDRVDEIRKASEEERRKREQEELIEKATAPLKSELEKEREERKRLEKAIESLSAKPASQPKSELDSYIELQDKLRRAGLLKEEETAGKITFGEGGIPVSGEIPAWAVYAPTVIDQIFDNIEKRISGIASNFGIGKTSKRMKDLINIPPRPTERPPIKPKPKPVEEPKPAVEPAVEPVEPEPPPEAEEPEVEPEAKAVEEELIKIPERKRKETALVASEIEPEEAEPEIAQKEEPEAEAEAEPEAEQEKPKEEPDEQEPEEAEPEEPAEEKKLYFCKFCGESFERSIDLARHVKNCPERSEDEQG